MTAPQRIVVLKKVWIHLSVVGGLIFLLLIFYNFYQVAHSSTHTNETNKNVNLLANEGDIDWYHAKVKQVTRPIMRTSSVFNSTESAQMDNLTTDEILSSSASPDSMAAMAAPIGSNQLIPESESLSSGKIQATDNQQASGQLQNPSSPYVIQAGTLIPGILITGIHSDLPGPIIAQVRAPVYDSILGKHLLIPQGTKLIGVYDTQIAYGQERLFVVWKRLLLPNGQSLELPAMPGVDVTGTAGFYDHTDHHYMKLFGSAALTSMLGAGVACNASSHQNAATSSDPLSALSKSMGESVMQTGLKLTEKNMDLRPTVEIRSGYHFQLVVTQDLVFDSSFSNTGLINEIYRAP
jgi:type IV secretory pathway VirB10-like protein